MYRKFVLVIISLLTVTMTFSSIIFAQGSSALKITKITVTPSPFKTGNTLNFSVEVENPTSKATYGDFSIDFSVKEDEAYKSIGTTNSPKLNAGEKRVVKIAQTYNASGNFKNLCFLFTPIDAPNEFGKNFQSCYMPSCVYNPVIIKLPPGYKPPKLNIP
ncbi:MAG TPA: hypothetical protein ACFYD6_12025 [Candidatus Brocadiia bacterium]|nr:hypothetical protein [Candidatus Brocadiales bacterium]